jgi:hypothetical protein
MVKKLKPVHPGTDIHPGEHLAEELVVLNMSAAELAPVCALSQRVAELLRRLCTRSDTPRAGSTIRASKGSVISATLPGRWIWIASIAASRSATAPTEKNAPPPKPGDELMAGGPAVGTHHNARHVHRLKVR